MVGLQESFGLSPKRKWWLEDEGRLKRTRFRPVFCSELSSERERESSKTKIAEPERESVMQLSAADIV